MNNLGFGVMIRMLFDDANRFEELVLSLGKKIIDLQLSGNQLVFTFDDESKVAVYDDGQSCCEERYLHTDDKLSDFVGATFMDAEVSDVEYRNDECEDHEVQFLKITTSKGVFTLETHNLHNGYYGGFWLMSRRLKESDKR